MVNQINNSKNYLTHIITQQFCKHKLPNGSGLTHHAAGACGGLFILKGLEK